MSLKSIGYADDGGRGGRFIVPDIVVINNNIAEVKKGTSLPQFEIQTGLIEQQQIMNQVSRQLTRQTDKYNQDQAEYDALIAVSPLPQYNQLKTDIQTLYNQVANVSAPIMTWSQTKQRYYVRRGRGIRNTPYNLYSYVVKKSTTHFIAVRLALSLPVGGVPITLLDDGNIVVQPKNPTVLNGTFSQILLTVNGVVKKTLYSIKRTFASTNIFLTGEAFMVLEEGDLLEINFDFTTSYSFGGNDSTTSAMVWGMTQPDPTNNNMNGQIVYNAPQTSQGSEEYTGVITPTYMGMNRNQSPSVKIVQF
jgi:hypothetical protein